MKRSTRHRTYVLPTYLVEEYRNLMDTKALFLMRSSAAEERELESLYGRLKNVWGRNNIAKLNTALSQIYLGLRSAQSELRRNSEIVDHEIEQELRSGLQKRWSALEKGRRRLKERRLNLEDKKKTWKDDIIRRQQSLMTRSLTFENRRTERTSVLNSLKRNQSVSTVLLKRRDLALSQNSELASRCIGMINAIKKRSNEALKPSNIALSLRMNALGEKRRTFLNGLKSRNWPNMPTMQELSTKASDASRELERHKELNRQALKAERARLETSLSLYEEGLLKQLWLDLVKAMTNLPDESRQFYCEQSESLVRKKLGLIQKDWQSVSDNFERELTKAGIKRADFLSQFDSASGEAR